MLRVALYAVYVRSPWWFTIERELAARLPRSSPVSLTAPLTHTLIMTNTRITQHASASFRHYALFNLSQIFNINILNHTFINLNHNFQFFKSYSIIKFNAFLFATNFLCTTFSKYIRNIFISINFLMSITPFS